MEHNLANALVLVVFLGVAAQWIGWRLKLPAIVLFVVAGVLVGPVFGIIKPSEDIGDLLQPMISLSVAIILFEGGLQLRFSEFKQAASGIWRLVTVGVVVGWVLGSLATYYIGGFSPAVAILFGAIMVITGPTVVIPMLRQAKLNRRTGSFLKWEGIINDPTGALLAVLVFEFFVAEAAGVEGGTLASIGKAIGLAVVLGFGGAWVVARAYAKHWIPEYLKAPVTLGLVLVLFSIANGVQHESGLLVVTVMGVALANLAPTGLEELKRFKEDIAVLLVSTIFVMLSADLEASTLAQLNWRTILLVFAMLFLVRPLAIYLSTIGAGMSWQERLFVGWIAPRGIVAAAVAGIFAPKLVEVGFEDANLLVPLIFTVIFTTVVLHGFSITFLARKLGLNSAANGILIVGSSPWTTELARVFHEIEDTDVYLADSSWHRLRRARMAGIPVLQGEVLSESLQESLELAEIGTVLSTTSNDAYNALVCRNFSGLVGTNRVYQIAASEIEEEDKDQLASDVRGHTAFSRRTHFEELWQLHLQGWRFYKTRVTETFDYDALRADMHPEAIMVANVRETAVQLFSTDESVEVKTGDLVIYYAPKRESDKRKEEKRKEEKERRKLENGNAEKELAAAGAAAAANAAGLSQSDNENSSKLP